MERRKSLRVNISSDAKCVLSDRSNDCLSDAVVKDIGMGGLCLLMKDSVSVNAPVRVEFTLPLMRENVETEGKVCWKRKLLDGVVLVGVEASIDNTVGGKQIEQEISKNMISWCDPKIPLGIVRDGERKFFNYEKVVNLIDTNAEGNLYFSRYFDIQGTVRESYLNESLLPKEYHELVVSKIRLITGSATIDYKKEAMLFDRILVTMTTRNVRKVSLMLHFVYRLLPGGEIIATGSQKLAFRDAINKIIPIPSMCLRISKEIEEETDIL